MHELSIADAIVKSVLQEMHNRRLPSVQAIVLHIGVLSDVDPEALRFGFEAMTADTALADTALKIELIPVEGRCRSCGQAFAVNDFVFACSACQSGQIEVTRGNELDIAYLEVDDVV